MLGVNLQAAIRVVAAYLYVAVRLLYENHALGDVLEAFRMYAVVLCCYGTGINLGVGYAGGVDSSIIVVA